MKNDNNAPLSEKSANPKNTAEFLQHFLVEELGDLINESGHPFLKFLPVISGIEFLGACYDEFPFEKSNESKKRFKKGISLMGMKYKPFDGSHKNRYPCLYTDFRCPMVHQFRTNRDKFRLTAVNIHCMDEIKSFHLQLHGSIYIIVLEELYLDLARAVTKTIDEIQTGKLGIEKLKEHHVVIRDMEILFTT